MQSAKKGWVLTVPPMSTKKKTAYVNMLKSLGWKG